MVVVERAVNITADSVVLGTYSSPASYSRAPRTTRSACGLGTPFDSAACSAEKEGGTIGQAPMTYMFEYVCGVNLCISALWATGGVGSCYIMS